MEVNRIWATTTFSLLTLVSLLQFRTTPTDCINSRIVHGLTNQADLSPALIRETNEDIEDVDKFFSEFHWSVRPVRAHLDTTDELFTDISATEINVGAKLFSTPGQFQRSLVQSVVMQNMDESFLRDQLALETLVDLLTITIRGNKKIEDPEYPMESLDLPELAFIHSYVSVCKTPWRPLGHVKFCRAIQAVAAQDSEKLSELYRPSPWSVRPILVAKFSDFYRDLLPTEKVRFLKRWLADLKNQKNVNENNFNILTLSDIHILANLQMKKIFGEQDLKIDDSPRIDLILKSSLAPDFQIFKNLQTFSVLINFKNKFYNSLTGEPLKLDSDPLLKDSARFAWQTCDKLSVGEISRVSTRDKHLLYVDACHDKNVDFASYIVGGIKTFATSNKKSTFIYYHIPSVKVSLKFGSNTKTKVSFTDVPQLEEKILGWDCPFFNKELGVYELKGPLPMVEYYRGPFANLTKNSKAL